MNPSAQMGGALHRELALAIELAAAAGAMALGLRDSGLIVERKADNEIVTAADRACSGYILENLRRTFAGDTAISEESADDLERLAARRVWFVDPIDGTKDYVRGGDGFCVMIGLLIEDRPALGVIFQPASHTCLAAVAGHGAWLTEGKSWSRLRCSEVGSLQTARVVATSTRSPVSAAGPAASAEALARSAVDSIGLKLGAIALGARDLYANPQTRCRVWDTCAPEVILHEAGGRLSDLGGAPLDYRCSALLHPNGLVATNGRIHALAIDKLSPFARC